MYMPRWVHLNEVRTLNVLPEELRAFLACVAESGWPDEAVIAHAGCALPYRSTVTRAAPARHIERRCQPPTMTISAFAVFHRMASTVSSARR